MDQRPSDEVPQTPKTVAALITTIFAKYQKQQATVLL